MAPANDRRQDPGQRIISGEGDRQRPVSRTPLYAVLAANAVSQVGDYMVAVAMPWFVLKTTGSVVQMGLAGAAIGIGTLLSSISGGPLIDRMGFGGPASSPTWPPARPWRPYLCCSGRMS